MKKLYEVNAKWYVMAEYETEAMSVRPDHLSEVSIEAYEAVSVDHEWWDSIPYNGDTNKTCGEYFNETNRSL